MKERKNQNLVDCYFVLRQDDLMEEMENDRDCLRKVLKQTNSKELQDMINQLPKEYDFVKKELYKKFEDLVGDYEIKLAYYNKKYYKQGFYDAIKLNCVCKEDI